MQLLEKSQLPNRVVAVATQGAKRETWQLFRSGICKTLKFSPELVEIPDGNNPDEIRQILESVANPASLKVQTSHLMSRRDSVTFHLSSMLW